MGIRKLQKGRALVSIRRDKIDDCRIQGFILGHSKNLLLIQYVYDFYLDGLMVIRREDVTDIKSTKVDRFQTELLKDAGLYEKIEFEVNYPLDTWHDFLHGVANDYPYLIVEDEMSDPQKFVIGKVGRLGKNKVEFKYFTGTARWLKKSSVLKYKNITSCQVGCNYLNFYERYLEGKARQ